MRDGDVMTLRQRVWLALESPEPVGFWPRLVNFFLIMLIVTNVAAVVLDSVASIRAVYGPALDVFEAVSVAIFTVEYLARLWASAEAGPRWRYALTPLAIIDLIAIVPSLLGALFGVDLRTLRALRLLRLLKLTRHFPELQVLGTVIQAETRNLLVTMLVMMVLIVVAASMMHFAERQAQPEAFGDIPHAMWWAAVTLTTVGYGDVTPVTMMGQAIAVVIMLLGVGMVALPAGLLASRFSEELENRRSQFVDAARAANVEHCAESLDDLRERFYLSEEDVERLLAEGRAIGRCPLCGGSLPGQGTAVPSPRRDT